MDGMSFSEIMEAIGPEGLLKTAGRTVYQLALVVGCVLLVRFILKKQKEKHPDLEDKWVLRPPQEEEHSDETKDEK